MAATKKEDLGGGFKDFLFSPLFGEDSHFDQYFSDGLKPPTRDAWVLKNHCNKSTMWHLKLGSSRRAAMLDGRKILDVSHHQEFQKKSGLSHCISGKNKWVPGYP